MASLADDLLEDLDDLDDDDDDDNNEEEVKGKDIKRGGGAVLNEAKEGSSGDEGSGDEEGCGDSGEEDEGGGGGDEDEDEDGANLDEILNSMIEVKKTNSVGLLRASNRYKDILRSVRAALERPCDFDVIGTLENDPEYKLILQCNKLMLDIDDDIVGTHRYVADIYSTKFPELDNHIPNKIDFIKVVERIGNEMDMTVVSLGDLLRPNVVMIVSVSGSTTSGKPLSEQALADCLRGCTEVLLMNSDKAEILKFIESRMVKICPNVCALVGSRVAAQMVGLAGGIISLSKIPSCNIQVMGQEKKNLAGLSARVAHVGALYFCDTVQRLPAVFRKKAMKLIAAKLALLARVDAYKNHADGSEGNRMTKDVEGKIMKWLEPAKARTHKALPIPQEKKKKSRRGGKRVKRIKERYAMTDVRNLENRMKFSTDVGEYGDSAMGMDRGMLGLGKDSGKLRMAQTKEVKFNSNKRPKTGNISSSLSINSNNQLNGLATTLAFTPVQGLELARPTAMADRVKEANSKWFNSSSGFMSAMPK